ncbi:hypothetical protein HID58_071246, partial [Brassica napus]
SFLPLVYGLRNSVQINQPSGFQLETAKKAGLKAVNNESITDAEKQNNGLGMKGRLQIKRNLAKLLSISNMEQGPVTKYHSKIY